MKLTAPLPLLLALALLTGCSKTGAGIDACGPWKPIYVSKEDKFTEGTAKQILAHNLTGQKICKW